MEKKDYMRLFVQYCRKHLIWFGVCMDGTVDAVTFGEFTHPDSDVDGDGSKFGSKAAYDWLKKTRQEILREYR